MEGVERYKVNLMPHNAAWEEEYKQVYAELKQCWNTNILDIQHIGSTVEHRGRLETTEKVGQNIKSMVK